MSDTPQPQQPQPSEVAGPNALVRPGLPISVVAQPVFSAQSSDGQPYVWVRVETVTGSTNLILQPSQADAIAKLLSNASREVTGGLVIPT